MSPAAKASEINKENMKAFFKFAHTYIIPPLPSMPGKIV